MICPIMTRNIAKSLAKKTIGRETGLVRSGTIVPFSYSPERLYIAVTIANRTNVRLPALKDTTK